MFRNSQTVVKLLGIEIRIAASWLLLAALITWSLAREVFPQELPDLSQTAYLGLGFAAMLLFFLSLLLHEGAHALVARHFGLRVPRITLFLFGGVAELEDEPDTPRHELWIALAGPAMSLALALIFWGLSRLPGISAPVALVPTYLAAINAVLAVFNLLPAFPLDGGRVLRALLWARSGDILEATDRAARIGAAFALALIALGVLSLFQGATLGGAWNVMLGVFLWIAARTSAEAQRIKSLLGARRVADIMTQDTVTAGPELPLSDLVNRVMLANRVSFVPVVEDGVLLGYIDAEVLSKIDRENWGTTQIGDVFVALGPDCAVPPELPADALFARLAETGRRKLLVAHDDHLDGVVTLTDLASYLTLLSDLFRGRAPPPPLRPFARQKGL